MPVGYVIGDLSPDVDEESQIEAIHRSFEPWAAVPELGLVFEFEGFVDESAPGNDGVNIVYFQGEGWDPESRAIATTHSFAYGTGELHGFDLPLNDARYTFTTTDDPELVQTDIQNTITHEVGHILGMDHSEDLEATMFTSTGLGDLTKRDLSEDDVLGIQALYKDAGLVYDDDSAVGCGCSQRPGESAGGGLSALMAMGLAFGLRRRREG